jgi:hypothetical protein
VTDLTKLLERPDKGKHVVEPQLGLGSYELSLYISTVQMNRLLRIPDLSLYNGGGHKQAATIVASKAL